MRPRTPVEITAIREAIVRQSLKAGHTLAGARAEAEKSLKILGRDTYQPAGAANFAPLMNKGPAPLQPVPGGHQARYGLRYPHAA